MAEIRLERHTGADDQWAIFCPTAIPAFRGAGPLDFLCSSCPTTLVEGAYDRQFLDVLFRCPTCVAENRSDSRPAGSPLAGRPILVPPGRYLTSVSVDLPLPVQVVGQQAIDGYTRETGARWASSGKESVLPPLSPDGLEVLAAELVRVLGDSYERIRAAYQRKLAARADAAVQHRLIHLREYVLSAAASLRAQDGPGNLTLDGDLLSEAWATVTMFRRWQFHPTWPELARSLVDPTSVQHTVMTLLVASYLVDSGNGVSISASNRAGRIPDLWAQPTVIERLEVEVKAPIDLRGPLTLPLDAGRAGGLIRRLLDEAGSSSHGQLDPTSSGVLAIGAFHLGPGGIETLERAAMRVLARQARRKPHVVGILVCEATYLESYVNRELTLTPVMNQRLIRHPGYTGGLEVRTDPDAHLQLPPDPAPRRSATAPGEVRPNRAARRRLERDERRNRL